jgi:ribonuclease P protein subunit RPR2
MFMESSPRERCNYYLALARKAWKRSPALAKRYVTIARRLAMRHRVRLGSKEFCKSCGAPFVPGITLRVRLAGKKALYICLACNRVKPFPYSKRKQ